MHTLQLKECDRTKIIFFRSFLNLTQREIARRLNCAQSTVSRVLLKQRRERTKMRKRGSGRRSLLVPSQQNIIKCLIRATPTITAKEIRVVLFERHGLDVSERSISRFRLLHFTPRNEVMTVQLTLQHHLDRLDFCMTHRDNDFRRVMFSDEKMFHLAHTSGTVWVERGGDVPPRAIQSTHTKIMVWAAVWYTGRTELHFVDGSITADYYQRVLTQTLLPSMPTTGNYILMQDNATAHTALSTRLFLRTFAVPVLDPWPAFSPDFNPIEHCWSWMTHYVKKLRPTNRATLRNAIERSWIDLPQGVIQGYINNLPSRMQRVEDAGGARLD